MNELDTTIAAIATPFGIGGIGIIKISGPAALSIAGSIFHKSETLSKRHKNSTNISTVCKSHHLYYGHILDPKNGHILDEVLFTFMKGPNSYTGEDVVEIHTHSGRAVLHSILNILISKGARIADPGEFTRRAFLHGRIDLTQAEAVIDLINANSLKSIEIAASMLTGNLKEIITSARDYLLLILTEIEAAIDFPEDIENNLDENHLLSILKENISIPLRKLIDHYDNGNFLRNGFLLTIAGRPNVGKSCLMNCLTQKERSIVTSIPGTTRDILNESISINGIPIIIADTAGIQDTCDPIETIGIQKAQDCIKSSDLILFVIDSSSPITSDDHKIYNMIKGKQLILVFNKSDLVDDDFMPDIPESWNDLPSIKISALYKFGFGKLKELIKRRLTFDLKCDEDTTILPNLRQKQFIEQSLLAVSSAIEGIKTKTPFELIAIDMNEAVEALNNILGITVKENILDQIFSKFCIGK
ncbi:MAG TPA: tRNA uridine-5-carboxymethylaminomethyl(34) synthesis GTPase MnmE [Desulfobacteraceae bacterium]|nr:tRNA uridine-5-carboxymethylaminomethyl(34) synthesis GTPase MnmE [Desulfobacteraceae bacterium]